MWTDIKKQCPPRSMVEAIEVTSRPLQLGIMQVRFLPPFSFLTHLLPRVSPNAYIRSGDHRMHTYSGEIDERKYLVLPGYLFHFRPPTSLFFRRNRRPRLSVSDIDYLFLFDITASSTLRPLPPPSKVSSDHSWVTKMMSLVVLPVSQC